eukprot:TRINITY_DN70971_c0_g1_i1.p2 TRINITY_DN70971_c0_g1~~TRINITY_DN70971_c0_g1_i1.p2  ORF type:complete len:242 (+),score=59.59 TRINITY_DN70971_c0_g1_i1:77-802(+)
MSDSGDEIRLSDDEGDAAPPAAAATRAADAASPPAAAAASGAVGGGGSDSESGSEGPPPEFLAMAVWSGPLPGYYFGAHPTQATPNNPTGIGYHRDSWGGVPAPGAHSRPPATPAAAPAAEPAGARQRGARGEQLSKREQKRRAKMTAEQRILLSGGATRTPQPQAGLPPEVAEQIAAQRKRKGPERYSYQKENPAFYAANDQRQAIWVLYRNERLKKRRMENQEAKANKSHIRVNKPAWT